LINLENESRSEAKRADGDSPVDAKMQSSIAGRAAKGTCLKLSDREEIIETIGLLSSAFIFTDKGLEEVQGIMDVYFNFPDKPWACLPLFFKKKKTDWPLMFKP
jgi:hypothetical protein